jgi:hypothetical protein
MSTDLSPYSAAPVYKKDWLLDNASYHAGIFAGEDPRDLVLSNGLLCRIFRLGPNAATIAFDNLMTDAALLRAVQPEARVELDGVSYDIGGLVGQEECAYLRREWVDEFTSDPQAFQFVSYECGPTQAPFAWQRVRPAPDAPWPAPGVRLSLRFAAPMGSAVEGVEAIVHYELYDGIPLLCKWLELQNKTPRGIRLNSFISELLAAVEGEVSVDAPEQWVYPDIHVESDYAFHGMTPKSANTTTHWV